MSDTETAVDDSETSDEIDAAKTEEQPEEKTTSEAKEESPETSEDESDAATSKEDEGEDGQQTEGEEDQPRKKSRRDRRLDNARKARIEAENEAQELRQQLAALQSSSEQEPEPKQEDFQSIDEFVLAKAEWRAEKAVARKLEQLSATVQQGQQQAEQAALAASWDIQVEDARDKYDDFDDVVMVKTNPVTPAMAQALAEEENGAEVAYHLGRNQKMAREIASLSPTQAVLRIGKLSAKLAQKPRPKQTAAPKPVKTVGGGRASPQRDPSKMSQKDFEAWMDKREKR